MPECPRTSGSSSVVGINVGDIIIDRDDIYGDGVNVAARLEGLAEPGGRAGLSRMEPRVRRP
jgi:class 3 adenylate cyclase